MNANNQHPLSEDPAVPPRLLKALAELPKPDIAVPKSADEAVLRAARGHLRSVTERRSKETHPTPWPRVCEAVRALGTPRSFWRPVAPWAAAVALLLLAALVTLLWVLPLANPAAGLVVEDVNHDGRVDILDAFALARQIERGSVPARTLDLNGDGVIDRRDVEIIVAHAVSLKEGQRL